MLVGNGKPLSHSTKNRKTKYIYISEQYEGRSQRARFDAPDWKLHHCGTM
jgi:hypothetical protein